jgi:Flp pilus assembly protein TadD
MSGVSGLIDRARAALARGDAQSADRMLQATICVEPERSRSYFNLGVSRARLSLAGDAERAYRRALLVEPGHEGAVGNLADLYLSAGRDTDAERICIRGSRWSPLTARIRGNLGLVRLRLGDAAAADADLRRTLCAEPGYAQGWQIMAMLHHDQADAADASYRRAWSSGLRDSKLLMNRGEIAQRLGRIEDALDLYGQALALSPRDPDLLANLATASIDHGSFEAAERYAGAALSVQPEHRVARWISRWVRLAHRDFTAGFRFFDETWASPDPDLPRHAREFDLWDGGFSSGTLLLWCEQGLGDEILYAGMIDDVLALGLSIVLETDPRLVPLFRRTWPKIRVVGRGDPLPPDIAVQSSVLRLPMFFRRRLEDFPPRKAYLRPDPARVERYREQFNRLGARKTVGLSWRSGNPRTGAGKSTRLVDWTRLLDLPETQFVSLQYDDGGETDPRVRSNPGDARNDIDDLAAQIAALDHVVSISGTAAHLAGALGTPGHVLLPPAPLWFWFAEGHDCPWYPSLTLHRRASGEEWAPAVERVADAVRTTLLA